ncbi:hypothetical protein ACQCT5_08370 [Sutcliffiella halmapala]
MYYNQQLETVYQQCLYQALNEIVVDCTWYRKLSLEIHSKYMEVFSQLSRK